jgi:hypothetical protein
MVPDVPSTETGDGLPHATISAIAVFESIRRLLIVLGRKKKAIQPDEQVSTARPHGASVSAGGVDTIGNPLVVEREARVLSNRLQYI